MALAKFLVKLLTKRKPATQNNAIRLQTR